MLIFGYNISADTHLKTVRKIWSLIIIYQHSSGIGVAYKARALIQIDQTVEDKWLTNLQNLVKVRDNLCFIVGKRLVGITIGVIYNNFLPILYIIIEKIVIHVKAGFFYYNLSIFGMVFLEIPYTVSQLFSHHEFRDYILINMYFIFVVVKEII